MTLWEKLEHARYDKPEAILARVKEELGRYPMGAVHRKIDRYDLKWLIEAAERDLERKAAKP